MGNTPCTVKSCSPFSKLPDSNWSFYTHHQLNFTYGTHTLQCSYKGKLPALLWIAATKFIFLIELLLQLTGLNKNLLLCLITHNVQKKKNCSVTENIWHRRVNFTTTEIIPNLHSPSVTTKPKFRIISSPLYIDIEKVYLILCGSIQFWNMNQHILELNCAHICKTKNGGRKITSVTY